MCERPSRSGKCPPCWWRGLRCRGPGTVGRSRQLFRVLSPESLSLLLSPAALSGGAQPPDAAKSGSQRPLSVSGHRDPGCRLGPSALTPALALQGVGCECCPGSQEAVHRTSGPVRCRTRCHTGLFGKLHLAQASMVGHPSSSKHPQTLTVFPLEN